MFYIFPITALGCTILGINKEIYDYVWIGLLGFIVFKSCFKSKLRIYRPFFIFISIISILVCFKYVIPHLFPQQIILRAAIMDGKWVIYLLLSIMWINSYGTPTLNHIYKAGLFFSILYIIVALIRIITGKITREGILMESNYDGFMILMVYCFIDEIKHKNKWSHWIFIFATFCTLSRTGIASLFAILFFKAAKKRPTLLLFLIPFFIIIIFIGFSIRGESAENLDRFIYFSQAFLYFQNTDIMNILVGNTPGVSLHMPILPAFEWTISNFENMRNLNGIFPFYFHSTYLRLAFTWGVIVSMAFLIFFTKKFFSTKYKPLKWFCLLTLIQSFSLSTLTLPNVSVLFFTLLILALKQEHSII
jgi:hypothetical protein